MVKRKKPLRRKLLLYPIEPKRGKRVLNDTSCFWTGLLRARHTIKSTKKCVWMNERERERERKRVRGRERERERVGERYCVYNTLYV